MEREHSDLISFAARDPGCKYIFPYDVMADYAKDVVSMALVQECAAGTYVSIAMRIVDVQPRRSLTQNETATAHGRCHGGRRCGSTASLVARRIWYCIDSLAVAFPRSCHALPQPD